MSTVPINIVVEDILSDAIARKLLEDSIVDFEVGTSYGLKGNSYIKKNIRGFNNASSGIPFLILTDLDQYECPPELIQEWLPVPQNTFLLFRVVVREIESWLIAHRESFARFAGVSVSKIPINVDEISNPKEFLINLIRKSRKKTLREALVPQVGSTSRIGPDYNSRLVEFVETDWDVYEASQNSLSLKRTIPAIAEITSKWFHS